MAGQRAGKSQMIGIMTGHFISNYPRLKGFIAANTYQQLNQSTLIKVFEIWRDLYRFKEYDSRKSPFGHYVINKKPPSHFETFDTLPDYNNTISFWNGHMIFIGSLDNYKAHDGKEFAYCHLDETKDTKEEAVTSVILARLSMRGLFVYDGEETVEWVHNYPGVKVNKAFVKVNKGDIVYIPNYIERDREIKARGFRAWNPTWIHTSPAIGHVEWLVRMFDLDKYEPEIRSRITGFLPDGRPDFFHHEDEIKCVVIFSTYHNAENLPDGYIAARLAVLSENEAMKFVFGYPFSKTGGEFFPHFSRLKVVTKVPFINGLPVHTSWDFNVLPYMTMLGCQVHVVDRYIDSNGKKWLDFKTGRELIRVMQIRVYKEYCFGLPVNTIDAICKQFTAEMAERHNAGLFYYGDSMGLNRIEGLGSMTRFKMVENGLHRFLHGGSKRVPGRPVAPLSRRDFLNRIFENKIPNVELYIDESCVNLIRDLEYLKLGVDGKMKEKVKDPQTGATYEKLGHTSDALEYFVCEILKQYMKTE